MSKNLVIVESPAKAKTIEGYLGKDFTVKSSFGHVRDLAKKGLAIEIENSFNPLYEVTPDKKALVAELKKLAKAAEVVWLATDEDREGEAISWHLYETLDLKKKDTKRITFNEITKTAILKAIDNPREINKQLVDAQQARRVLDRIVGFELSPVLWKKIRPSLSAGRVQSVAVKLIVEREKEIDAFNVSNFFRITGNFESKKGNFKAEYSKQLADSNTAKSILEECIKSTFFVEDIQQKPAQKSPAAPFTTSTLQQEASLKLGFSVTRTMSVAQRLYESGKITYMRTDSVNLSETAILASKEAIIAMYGTEFSKTRKYANKNAGAQEAHEAIRPTDFMVPKINAESEEERLYELIWKRAIASQMSDAQLERTTIKIGGLSNGENFNAKGEVIRFEGFLKVYLESSLDDSDDDNDSGMLPAVVKDEKLDLETAIALERFTRPPARYVEASLVKKLEELGIGRPSTYAPTISTIQKRGYVEKKEREGEVRNFISIQLKKGIISQESKSETTGKDKNKLSPTDIGIVVTDFLQDNFKQIMDYHFTASVEAQFDEIARGKQEWTKMMDGFYNPFHKEVEDTLENSERATGERDLGIDPVSGKKIIARIGKFGPMIQIGDEKVDGEKARFASLQKDQSIGSISLEDALELFKLPRTLGEHEGLAVKANNGRFGPYVQVGKLFVSIPKEEDAFSISFERALELYLKKLEDDANKMIKVFEKRPEVQLLNGRYGAYLKIGKDNFKLPKGTVAEDLSLEECIKISESQEAKPKKKKPFAKK